MLIRFMTSQDVHFMSVLCGEVGSLSKRGQAFLGEIVNETECGCGYSGNEVS